jgi:hypothetical protein
MGSNLCLILEMGKLKEPALMANHSDIQPLLIVEKLITLETEDDGLLRAGIIPVSNTKITLP